MAKMRPLYQVIFKTLVNDLVFCRTVDTKEFPFLVFKDIVSDMKLLRMYKISEDYLIEKIVHKYRDTEEIRIPHYNLVSIETPKLNLKIVTGNEQTDT